MKRLLIVLVFILVTFNYSNASSSGYMKICVNGEYLTGDELSNSPSIDEDIAMLPLRRVMEALGFQVVWKSDIKAVQLKKDSKNILVPISKNYIIVDSQKVIVDTPAEIINNRAYIPIGKVFDAIGYDAIYDSKLHTIFINKQTDENFGLNLSHNHYWSTQWMFVDFMKQSWTWMPQDIKEREWDISDVIIPVDKNGYPIEVPFTYNNQSYKVHTLMFYDNGFGDLKYPSGTYHLYFEGDGEIVLDGDIDRLHFSEPNIYHSVNIANPTMHGINLIINRSSKDNPIRNIKFIMPGYKETHEINPYHPRFLEYIQPVSTIRFMKPLYIEEFKTVSWEERTTPDYYTQSDMLRGGLSYEHIIDLSNRTGKNPWINLPYGVDDTYVKELALYIRDNLRKDLKIYIEYANEPFNSMYGVYEYSIEKGLLEGITAKNRHLIGAKYAAKRTIEIYDIIDDILPKNRYISLLTCEFFNIEQGEATIEIINDSYYNPNEVKIDALSIAPYFGGEVANDIGDRITKDLSLENIFKLLEKELDTIIYDGLWDYKALADKYGLDLIAYEGGQHFVSLFYPEDDLLIKLMKEVSYDDRMELMYKKLKDMWFQVGGGLMCYFESVEAPHNYGDFGIIRHLNEEWNESPKYRAVFMSE